MHAIGPAPDVGPVYQAGNITLHVLSIAHNQASRAGLRLNAADDAEEEISRRLHTVPDTSQDPGTPRSDVEGREPGSDVDVLSPESDAEADVGPAA